MKDYAAYPRSSISMSKDEKFLNTIDGIFRDNVITTIIESGTFKGTGSTTTIAESVVRNKVDIECFYTIEVDYRFYTIAKKNLKKYKFIHPIWGLSVDQNKAISFIENDDAIKNHSNYPDVYIDTLNNPVEFYLNEINGQLSKTEKKKPFFLSLFADSKKHTEFAKNVFATLLPKVQTQTSLILLDSAGGIGFLEFKTVLEYLADAEFIIILDDIHHLKHFRSLQFIRESGNFKILNESLADGWVVAKYSNTGL